MGETMKGVRIHAPGDLRLDRIGVPELGPFDVKIAVAHTGVCGTDLHIYDGWQMGPMVTLQNYPALIGHELAGTIAAVGEAVTTRRVGERVTVQPQIYCGVCVMCERGNGNMCRNKIRFAHGGSWADYLVVNEKQAYRIPDAVSTELASLSEPLGCAMRAVERARISPGDTALVTGGGTIGLMLVALAKRLGTSLVACSEPVAARRQLAKRLGADLVFDPVNEDLEGLIGSATAGVGFDISFEASGAIPAAEACIAAVRDGGTVIQMAISHPDEHLRIRPLDVCLREIDIRGTVLMQSNMESVLRLMPQLGLEPMITHVLPLAAATEAILMCKRGEATKVLFDPTL